MGFWRWGVLCVLAGGCAAPMHSARPATPAEQMVSAIGLNMNADQLIRAYGQPKQKSTDPLSGFDIWSYEPEKGSGIVYVSFNDDKVVGVRSATLNRTAIKRAPIQDP